MSHWPKRRGKWANRGHKPAAKPWPPFDRINDLHDSDALPQPGAALAQAAGSVSARFLRSQTAAVAGVPLTMLRRLASRGPSVLMQQASEAIDPDDWIGEHIKTAELDRLR